MKKLFIFLISLCLLLIPVQVNSQASVHSSVLTWTLSADDTSANCPSGGACSQNVYRASGNCNASANFQILSNAIPGNWTTTVTPAIPPPSTFTDATVAPGTWCYAVSFVLNGAESPKVSVQALITPAAPSSLVIVAK